MRAPRVATEPNIITKSKIKSYSKSKAIRPTVKVTVKPMIPPITIFCDS